MKPVIMPKLGLTMEEGIIADWLKKEGDPVEKGEILLRVETDKATNEIEATISGTLGRILLKQGG
jgi:pyruvate/2-oxoglutarate dehydrogenase complex dihydrolipoamide acyltransferase (E2) component